MTPYYEDADVTLFLGDCVDVMKALDAGSVDAIVTDPPYGLEFMGKEWDRLRPSGIKKRGEFGPGRAAVRSDRFAPVEYGGVTKRMTRACSSCGKRDKFTKPHGCPSGAEWLTIPVEVGPSQYALAMQKWHLSWTVEALRVLKPGGHMVCFGGTRTHHRLWCAVEDAGFEVRDCLMYVYGSGFPKSLDVSKSIDKAGEWNREFDDVRAWLRQKVKEKGLKHSEIDRAIGNENSHMASHFLGISQPMLPTWDQWLIIKQLLGVDEDIDRPPKCIGYERAIIGYRKVQKGVAFTSEGVTELPITLPATDAARQWQGWGTALKPAWESIILARKPFTISGEQDIIVGSLTRLEAQLWSLLPANIAADSFGLSPAGHKEVCAFAQWPADKRDSIQADLLAQMDMSQFVSVMTTCLNTVMSWSNTLAVLLNPVNTSTTETANEQTTDWRTLNLSVSVLTPASIIQAEIEAPGSRCAALPAARYLNVVSANIAHTQELSALAAAISSGQAKCPVEVGRGFQPNFTPILLARKPIERTVAHNVQKHGTGALNVDGCRIEGGPSHGGSVSGESALGQSSGWNPHVNRPTSIDRSMPSGRWPANLVLDEEAAAMLDAQSGERERGRFPGRQNVPPNYGGGWRNEVAPERNLDGGGASRFFYTSKAGSDERGGTKHPTVKPRDLMLWLCKLVTPPNGLILDPFIGSGTTAVAARMGGFRCVGIDNNEEYLSHAAERLRLGDEGLCQVNEARKQGSEQGVLW